MDSSYMTVWGRYLGIYTHHRYHIQHFVVEFIRR